MSIIMASVIKNQLSVSLIQPRTSFPLLTIAVCALQIEANYDEDEARKCLFWMQLIVPLEQIPNTSDAIDASSQNFHQLLADGMILLK